MYKILVYGLHTNLGGSETYILNLMKKLDMDKYDFYFLIIDDYKGGKCPIENAVYNLYPNYKERFFYCPNKKKEYFKAITWLKHFYDDNKFDLIYLNATTAANFSYCSYPVKKYNTPIITHSHRSDGNKINHYLYRPYLKWKSSKKLACSELAANWMFGVGDKDCIIVPNGIDEDRFDFSKENRATLRHIYNVSKDDVVIGHVGRFVKEKNHMFFLKLAKELEPKYKFLLVGDGELKENFLSCIKESNLQDRFIVLPVQDDIEKYYSMMDIFMMPSINEGLPIVAVEAQCSGLKCLFSNGISTLTDISNKNYFLPLDDMSLWVSTIKTMNTSRYDGKKVIIDSGYSNGNVAKLMDSVFTEIVNKH